MFVGYFHHQLSSYRLPGKILAVTPPAHSARHALPCFATCGPIPPGVIGERILAIGRQVIYQIPPHLLRKTGANTDVLQRTVVVEEAEQQRTHCCFFAFLVPAKPRHHAIAVTLVLDFEHDPLV